MRRQPASSTFTKKEETQTNKHHTTSTVYRKLKNKFKRPPTWSECAQHADKKPKWVYLYYATYREGSCVCKSNNKKTHSKTHSIRIHYALVWYISVFKSVRTQLFVCMTKAYTIYVGGNPMA